MTGKALTIVLVGAAVGTASGLLGFYLFLKMWGYA